MLRLPRSGVHRRWFINRTNPEFVDYISKTASISPVLARILINRGIKSGAAVKDFLRPGITGLSDPFELPDMRVAVERIKTALRLNNRVLVHGDYDTDGLTATAIMVQALRMIGIEVGYFIPNRMVHGYGFNRHAVDSAKKNGVKLIITVDCGITSFDTADYAYAEGIDVIITDHHEPLKKSDFENEFLLPEAVAVVNPKLKTQDSKLVNLSGAGIAFKVAQALAMDGDMRFSADDSLSLLDLAALGTVADVVPLTGDNRIILKEGMQYIHKAHRPGIRALKEVSGLNARSIKAGLLSFTVVPRINAAGRVSDSGDVIRLLLSGEEAEAMDLAAWLDRLNSERQKIEEAVYREALEKIEVEKTGQAIVLSGEGWHEGVLGIVASRIAEEFYRPTFILSIENGIAKGSARSVPSFDICKGLAGCKGHLLSFGGHKQAAGLRLEVGNIPAFKEAIRDMIKNDIGENDLSPSLEIDAYITLPEITHALVKELEALEPVGNGNPEPLFGSKELQVLNPRIVGGNHLKMRLKKNSHSIDTIGFDMGAFFEGLDLRAEVDAVFTPGVNEWHGGRYLQLVLRGLRPSR